jgi:hypothetical protein
MVEWVEACSELKFFLIFKFQIFLIFNSFLNFYFCFSF